MHLSIIISGQDYDYPLKNWGEKLPVPTIGLPYIIVLERYKELNRSPFSRGTYSLVRALQTEPVEKILHAGERRVVFEVGSGIRFCFQLEENPRDRGRAYERLARMET